MLNLRQQQQRQREAQHARSLAGARGDDCARELPARLSARFSAAARDPIVLLFADGPLRALLRILLLAPPKRRGPALFASHPLRADKLLKCCVTPIVHLGEYYFLSRLTTYALKSINFAACIYQKFTINEH